MRSLLHFLSWNLLLLVIQCHTAEVVESVQQRLLSSNFRDDIVSDETLQRNFPFLKSSCVRDALRTFLPICLKQGVESIESSFKVETAVKLSICEFQVAGLGHIPDSCKNTQTDSMMDCMIQLESSAQWWTTYSGNYQRLSSICFENSLPYEKEQILSLFLNITNIQSEINDNFTRHFYNMMSNVESSSDEHLQTIAQLFKEYLKQFDETFKDKQTEFEGYQDDMQSLIVQNSQFIKKQNVGFMQSMDSLQHMIDGIIMDLKNDEISQQIVEVQNENLDSLKQMKNLMQEIYQFQRHGQTQMNDEMQLFFENTKKNMDLVTDDVKQSQLRAVEELRVSLLPSIIEELAPQLSNIKEDLLEDWKSATYLMNTDFQSWNNQINDTFQQISLKLNTTLGAIDNIDRSLSKFEKILTRVSQLITCISTFTQYTFSAVYHFSTSKYVWRFFFITFAIKRFSLQFSWGKLLSPIAAYAQVMAKFCLLIFAIYGGSKLGNIIMSVGT
ncbi:hypothetical protein ZYGR_0P00410 [Zygosaccharomyces rouxii]|uniref:Nuclear fusion protein KAR5 n=2 Tax=Zygosaccharomyces rouxii TaxID=4956 RepID=C5E3X8_ZYGRC|nr:uncharacterized protein ZYRO0E01100g [Zygosaccharomyces rouxii]KAH9198398.1 Tht1-like nuclear fusion protein-domain-containing protein [Zygosaccharomyces rouxii]GAV49398.1 hypothetical protein ZYGR_0P00410 [Zygosaccharomyces rouxii]CAR30739.1 ZYRO0E01100p [Zygosaccharomyces rouxii]